MKTLRKSHIIFIILGLLVITLFLMEGVYRLLEHSPFPHQVEDVVPIDICRFDDQFGWSLIPESQAISNRTGVPVEYRINSHGFRGKEYNLKKTDDTFRIVTIGDSRTFGYGVEEHYHFLTILEKYYKNVEVLNLGVSGFGVDQMLLYLKLKGFLFNPDLVMAYVPHYRSHRHMHTGRFGKQKPMYLLSGGKLVLTNFPVPTSNNRVAGLLGETYYLKLKRVHSFLKIKIGLYYFITNDLPDSLHKLYDKISRKRLGNKIQKKRIKEDLEEFIMVENEIGFALVSEINRLCKEKKVPFVLVSGIEDLYKRSQDSNIISLSVIEALPSSIYKISKKLKHINPPGNGVLTWEIYRFLKKENLIPLGNYR